MYEGTSQKYYRCLLDGGYRQTLTPFEIYIELDSETGGGRNGVGTNGTNTMI